MTQNIRILRSDIDTEADRIFTTTLFEKCTDKRESMHRAATNWKVYRNTLIFDHSSELLILYIWGLNSKKKKHKLKQVLAEILRYAWFSYDKLKEHTRYGICHLISFKRLLHMRAMKGLNSALLLMGSTEHL